MTREFNASIIDVESLVSQGDGRCEELQALQVVIELPVSARQDRARSWLRVQPGFLTGRQLQGLDMGRRVEGR